MNFSLISFLAWRYLTRTNSNSRINIVTILSCITISLATFCLTLQLCVSDGFDKALTEKMQSIYPQLTIEAPADQSFEYETIKKRLYHHCPAIKTTAPAHTKRIVIKAVDQQTPSVVTLKAIDPLLEPTVSSIENKLENKTTLKDAMSHNKIIIGSKLAEFHDITVGDSCTLLFTSNESIDTNPKNFDSVTVTIGAIMYTGIIQYDKYSALCSLKTMAELLQESEITQIGIKLNSEVDEQITTKIIEDQFNFETHSWKTLYPALVAATKLQKYVMALLLLLMIIIATSTIIALIFMHITSKKRDIAVLKTLGMNDTKIVQLFTLMGAVIIIFSSLLGVLLALLTGFLLQKYPFITLPDAYFCSHLPVYIAWHTPLLVLLCTGVIGTLIAWFSAQITKKLNITHILRFES